MPKASCADCEWEAEAPTTRIAVSLLERHLFTEHQEVPF